MFVNEPNLKVNRTTVTKFIADTLKPRSYLEIGVDKGGTWNAIKAPFKVGVDPRGAPATHQMTSDEWFEYNPEKKFDLILVDGLHTYHQCFIDITNALHAINPQGWIVVDDINPWSKRQAHPEEQPQNQGGWQGECYKSWIKIRQLHHNFGMVACKTVGIISRMLPAMRMRISEHVDSLTYEDFAERRNYLLNQQSWKLITSYIAIARVYHWDQDNG